MTNFEKAIEFNKSFGVFVSDTVVRDIFDTNPSLSKLRLSLIVEEINELMDAFSTRNFVEVIDALADILVVVYGAGASFGINLDNKYEYLLANCEGDNNYEITRNLLIKFKKVELVNSLTNIFDNTVLSEELQELLDTTLKSVVFYRDELKDAHDKKDMDKFSVCLLKIIEFTYTISCVLGIDIQRSYQIVHDSNMSKLCSDEQEAKDTVSWYQNNQTRYDSPAYKKSDDGINWVVFNNSTGKILKSIKYIPANFDCLLN